MNGIREIDISSCNTSTKTKPSEGGFIKQANLNYRTQIS